MAKKYIQYDYLATAHRDKRAGLSNNTWLEEAIGIKTYFTETAWRFPGTLGRHGFVVEEKMCGSDSVFQVTGVTTSGDETGTVVLRPGETLGYNCGEVWIVPAIENVRDPIKRARMKNRLRRDQIQFVSKDFVLELENQYLSAGEGYVTFRNGEDVTHYSDFGVCTTEAKKVGPIDQRYYLGRFIIIKGTPAEKVEEFIDAVCAGDWVNNPATRHPFAVKSDDWHTDLMKRITPEPI